MTKEQFIKRWRPSHLLMLDLEAVIAHEIAKVKEVQPEKQKGNCSTFDGSRLVDQVQPAEQPAKPFDKERFEAMFRAVVASGEKLNFFYCKREATYFLQQLDAYYATKEGGNNE